jgi:hypothetical protein
MAQKSATLTGPLAGHVIEYELPQEVYRSGFLPAYEQIPKGEDCEPVANLNASAIVALITPCDGYPAPVRSVTVRLSNPNSKRGKKLVDVASLLAFLDALPNDGERC